MNFFVNGQDHGPVHIAIGGAWNEGDLLDNYSYLKHPIKLLLFKALWRRGLTRCPSTCVRGEVCASCAVPQEYLDEYGARSILEQANIIAPLATLLYTDIIYQSDEYFEGLLKAVEDPGIVGEMFSSNAAYDPTFWPLHGSMDRLVGLKRILVSEGLVDEFDETWGYAPYNEDLGAVYLQGRCDWSLVNGAEDLTLPTCDAEAVCEGHQADDVLPFTNLVGESESYTNSAMYDFIHPWNEDLPYVYDTYDFDYCMDDADVDFLAGIGSESVDPRVYQGYGKEYLMKKLLKDAALKSSRRGAQ